MTNFSSNQVLSYLNDPMWKTKWAYGLLSLSFLWIFGGGDFSVFGVRSLIAGTVLCLLLINDLKSLKSEILNFRSLKIALFLALGLGLILGVAFHFSNKLEFGVILAGGPLAWFKQLGESLKSAPAIVSVLGALPLVAAWALVSRKLLQSDWGLSGVAFLDALTIGMGSQSAALFMFTYLIGLFCGWQFNNFGFGLAFWTQILSVLSLLVSSWVFYT